MKIDDLRAKLVTATAKVEAALAADDNDAALRALDAEDAARAEVQAEEAKARRLALALAVRDARKTAAGAYSVAGVDVAGMLPDADPEKLPGGGVWVVRSHTTASKKAWDADVGVTGGRAMADIMADLTCENLVRVGGKGPDASGKWDEATAFAVRGLMESELGNGLPNQIGSKILALGGAQATEMKRASK